MAAPKKTKAATIGLLLAFGLSAHAGGTSDVRIDNQLTDCLSIQMEGKRSVNNLTLLRLAIKGKQRTSQCGCKSKVLRYDVDGLGDGYEAESVITGEFVDRGTQQLDILLDSDNSADMYSGRRITFGCQLPL